MAVTTFALVASTFILTATALVVPRTMHQLSFNASKEFCTEYRRDLELHSAARNLERWDATKLGISGAVLSFIPFAPGIPLGIGAIVLGARGNTDERRKMLAYGIRDHNWKELNIVCANTLQLPALRNVTFDGPKKLAIDLGIAATLISLFSGIVLVVYLTLPNHFVCGCIDGCCFRHVFY